MNVLSEDQAATRQLILPSGGVLEGLPSEFLVDLQCNGAFVEYHQQVIVAAGETMDFVSCVVAGRVKTSRLDADYAKAPVATLGAGEWFGLANLFTRDASRKEVYADGEVVIWTISPDTLRQLFFNDPNGTQLLYNIAQSLAEKLTSARSAAKV
jgi:CRP-like cAMP-binding protein